MKNPGNSLQSRRKPSLRTEIIFMNPPPLPKDHAAMGRLFRH